MPAYHAALEEITQDRVPLNSTMSLGNYGIEIILRADRCDNAPMSETALREIETARDVCRDGGHAVNAAYYEGRPAGAAAQRLTARR